MQIRSPIYYFIIIIIQYNQLQQNQKLIARGKNKERKNWEDIIPARNGPAREQLPHVILQEEHRAEGNRRRRSGDEEIGAKDTGEIAWVLEDVEDGGGVGVGRK